MDRWAMLHEIAANGEEVARIEVTDDPCEVVLVWPDGSKAGLYWSGESWRWAESLDTAPCDVSARDVL